MPTKLVIIFRGIPLQLASKNEHKTSANNKPSLCKCQLCLEKKFRKSLNNFYI